MKFEHAIAFVSVLAAGSFAAAMVKPSSLGGPMKHIDITFDSTSIGVHVDESVPTPLLQDLRPGSDFTDQYAVLNGTLHNAQYGWNPGGFISLPANSAIFVKLNTQSPELHHYEGRGSLMAGTQTMIPIFGTAGSGDTWQWLGSMTHNWAAVMPGDVSPGERLFASFDVYVGDSAGNPLPGLDAATVRLEWIVVPEPATLAALGAAGLLALSRR